MTYFEAKAARLTRSARSCRSGTTRRSRVMSVTEMLYDMLVVGVGGAKNVTFNIPGVREIS
ncbi:hypothetical protein IMZ48_04525 [Candidatus Bathyarchaeota archaeon]|nr:hypothetical protein [Candidatus Bathyarchaeota archaeon]